MRVLELFSGTGSVGKICREYGWEVVSLDLKNADINCDIMDWDYTKLEKGSFDIIWASPPCNTFSCLQYAIKSKTDILKNIEENGLPILRKTEEIIDYFKPKYYFIENPQTGKMKEYLSQPFYDVDYCMYSDWGYKKRTRIWTNKTNFTPLLCNKKCGNMVRIGDKHIHKNNCGKSALCKLTGNRTTLNDRYRIPPQLIKELLDESI
jgi:hypothetical protein